MLIQLWILLCLKIARTALRYVVPPTLLSGYVDPSRSHNQGSFSTTVTFSRSVSNAKGTIYYREWSIVLSNVTTSWSLSTNTVSSSNIVAIFSTGFTSFSQSVGTLGYFIFDAVAQNNFDIASYSSSNSALSRSGVQINFTNYLASNAATNSFSMYSSGNVKNGFVAHGFIPTVSGFNGRRFFFNYDPLHPTNPTTVPDDSNIYGYSLTGSLSFYGYPTLTLTISEYTQCFSYSVIVIAWTKYISLYRNQQYLNAMFSYSNAQLWQPTYGPSITSSYSFSKNFYPSLASHFAEAEISAIHGLRVERGNYAGRASLSAVSYSFGTASIDLTVSQVSRVQQIYLSIAFFVKKECSNPNQFLDNLRTSCVNSCSAPFLPDALVPVCGFDYTFSQGNPLTPCHYSCLTCGYDQGPSTTNVCFYCQPLNARVWNNDACVCDVGFFQTGVAQCSQCVVICRSCQNLADNCTSCNSAYRVQSGTTCACRIGYYDSGSIYCSQCHFSCRSCNGPESTNCLTCDSNVLRVKSGSKCICSAGYFSAEGVAQCQLCKYSCLTCTNGTHCTSCDTPNHFRSLASNQCVCLAGYYQTFVSVCPSCQNAPYYCSTCNINKECLTCVSANFRQLDSKYCVCKSTYFDNGAALCQACSSNCLNCNGSSTTCTSCDEPSGKILVGSLCLCKPATSSSCTSCHYSCKTCTSSLTSGCLSCDSDNHRTGSFGSCLCQSGYLDLGKAQCQACHFSCTTCSTNSNQCTSCISSNRYLVSGTCPCNPGFYQVSMLNVCQPCRFSCLECSGFNNCTVCPSTRSASSEQCLCNPGYSQSGVSACILCHTSCLTCFSSDRRACLSCNSLLKRTYDNYRLGCTCINGFLDTGAALCSSCDASVFCKTCQTSVSFCKSCTQAGMRTVSGVCDCSTDFYKSGSSCLPCHFSCLTCSSGLSTNCLKCQATNFRQGPSLSGQCYCDIGFFQNGVVLCGKCLAKCMTCASSLNCLSCVVPRINVACDCPPNGFISLGVCYLCHYSCLTCFDSLFCASCQPFRDFFSGRCTCKNNYYDAGSPSCQPFLCPANCQTCVSQQCAVCQSNFILINLNCQCHIGFLQVGSICLPCNSDCKTCVQSVLKCQTCHTNFHAIDIQGRCRCIPSTFQTANTCTFCGLACLICSSPINCLVCQSKNSLFRGACLTVCQSDEYYQSAKGCLPSCLPDRQFNISTFKCDQQSTLANKKRPFFYKLEVVQKKKEDPSTYLNISFSLETVLLNSVQASFLLEVDGEQTPYKIINQTSSFVLIKVNPKKSVGLPTFKTTLLSRAFVRASSQPDWLIQNRIEQIQDTQLLDDQKLPTYFLYSNIDQIVSYVPLAFSFVVLSRSFLIIQNYQLSVLLIKASGSRLPFALNLLEFHPLSSFGYQTHKEEFALLVWLAQIASLGCIQLLGQLFLSNKLLLKRLKFFSFNMGFYYSYVSIMPTLTYFFKGRLSIFGFLNLGLIGSSMFVLLLVSAKFTRQLFGVFMDVQLDSFIYAVRCIRHFLFPFILFLEPVTSLIIALIVNTLFLLLLFMRKGRMLNAIIEGIHTVFLLLVNSGILLLAGPTGPWLKDYFFVLGEILLFLVVSSACLGVPEVIWRGWQECVELSRFRQQSMRDKEMLEQLKQISKCIRQEQAVRLNQIQA